MSTAPLENIIPIKSWSVLIFPIVYSPNVCVWNIRLQFIHFSTSYYFAAGIFQNFSVFSSSASHAYLWRVCLWLLSFPSIIIIDSLFISSKPSTNLTWSNHSIRLLDAQTVPSPASSRPALPPPAHTPSPVCPPSCPQVGDQILEVNGRSFLSIPHDEAVRVLKSSHHLMMTVKDVGRLPHTRTVVGETKWIASSQISDSSASSSVTGWVRKTSQTYATPQRYAFLG